MTGALSGNGKRGTVNGKCAMVNVER